MWFIFQCLIPLITDLFLEMGISGTNLGLVIDQQPLSLSEFIIGWLDSHFDFGIRFLWFLTMSLCLKPLGRELYTLKSYLYVFVLFGPSTELLDCLLSLRFIKLKVLIVVK